MMSAWIRRRREKSALVVRVCASRLDSVLVSIDYRTARGFRGLFDPR
ncbi:hypothetical protein [Nocardia africana]|uniref:Uncharacterized protein n=1 Tax=Nocardia africana TaxID=134964 RepID=A0ABW6NU56_9NOCA